MKKDENGRVVHLTATEVRDYQLGLGKEVMYGAILYKSTFGDVFAVLMDKDGSTLSEGIFSDEKEAMGWLCYTENLANTTDRETFDLVYPGGWFVLWLGHIEFLTETWQHRLVSTNMTKRLHDTLEKMHGVSTGEIPPPQDRQAYVQPWTDIREFTGELLLGQRNPRFQFPDKKEPFERVDGLAFDDFKDER